MAQVEGTKITYPLFTRETPQKTLGDFGTSTYFLVCLILSEALL